MRDFIELLLVIGTSFACGYAVREWISRRRRAAEREKFLQRHPEARDLQ